MLLLLDLPQVILCAPAGFAAGDFLYSCWMCRRLFYVLESCYRLCKVNKFWFARMYRLCEVNGLLGRHPQLFFAANTLDFSRTR